jgi:hypothetical protein
MRIQRAVPDQGVSLGSFGFVQSRDPEVLKTACWDGALNGLAAEVLKACDAAVELGREDRPCIRIRAVWRAVLFRD